MVKVHLRDQISERIAEEMKEHPPGIAAVYLFGSCAAGDSTERSDVDLAFLFEEKSYRTDPLEAFSECTFIATNIGRELGRKTDVVVLNSASLEIAYEIITSGHCIYQAHPESRLTYEAKTIGLWFDFKPFVQRLRREALRAL